MRPLNPGALADIHRTAVRIAADRTSAYKEAARQAREHRQPKQPAAMPTVHVGDSVVVGNRALTVVKVNAKSVVTAGGSRWVASEIESVVTA